MVPNGWKFENLEDLEGSQRPVVKAGPFGSSLKKEFYTKTGYKVYGQEQVIANDAFYGDYYIDEQRYQLLKSCAVEPDDILISLVGTIGKVLLVPNNAQPGVINPRLLRISLNKTQMSSKFFKYFLESRPTVNLLDRWAQGGTMGVLNAATLKALIVPVPPLLEQQKIAKILFTWDKAISTTERLIDNSKQQKKALMQQLLTGKQRLLDDAGKRFTGDWEETYLEKHMVSFTNGYAFSASSYKTHGIPIITMGNIGLDGSFNERITKQNFWQSDSALDKFLVSKGDLLIAMTDVTPDKNLIGRMTIVTIDKSFYLNQRVGLIRLKPSIDKIFLKYLSNDLNWRKYSMSVSASGVQANMSTKDIKIGTLRLPSIKEQQKIAAVLTNADQEIDLLKQQLADLQQEKKALMQVLLTGKRRVVV